MAHKLSPVRFSYCLSINQKDTSLHFCFLNPFEDSGRRDGEAHLRILGSYGTGPVLSGEVFQCGLLVSLKVWMWPLFLL
jgi:hypothetical protein